MKKVLLSSMLLISSLTMSSLSAAEKNYSLTLTNPDEAPAIEIELYTGSVNIVGYDGKTVEISAKTSDVKESALNKQQKKMRARMQDAMRKNKPTTPRSIEGLKPVKSAMMNIEIEEQDNDIKIISETMNQHVDLVLKVPFHSSIAVEVYQGGDIVVADVKGSLELESYQGGVTAKNVSGPIVAETYTQDIVVELSDFDDNTPTSLTSHAGNVDITLSEGIKANVNVQTYQGEIFSGLSSEFVAVDQVKKNNKGKKQKIVIGGTLQAKVNGGGQDLSLATYIGNLYIRTN